MTSAQDWTGRVGQAWADEWRRTDRTFAPLNAAIVERVAVAVTDVEQPKLLDIGCGAGSTSLALAERLPSARITGVDLSQPMIEIARERANGNAVVDFVVGDIGRWMFPGGERFDAMSSRHGVMFFDDPVAAFGHLASLAAPGAPLVFSCFRDREANGWISQIMPLIETYGPPPPPEEPAIGPFAFADPDRVTAILKAAGFEAIELDPLDYDFVAGADEHAVDEATEFFARIGAFVKIVSELDKGTRERALGELRDIVDANHAEGRVIFAAAAWIVTARAGSGARP